MNKEYALKIENKKHGLIFHMLFTPEEFEKTQIGVGRIEITIRKDKQEESIIDSAFYNTMELYKLYKQNEKKDIIK